VKTKGALLWEPGTRSGWSVEEIELDDPRKGEVLVKLAAAGLCHSDYHYDAGDGQIEFSPLLGGHEGAGVVQEVGEGVTTLRPGDHVITSFMPSCGHCHWCRIGRGNLCDRGADLMQGVSLDGTHRIHARGQDVGPMTFTGTFSPYIVAPVDSLVKFDDDISPKAAAIVGCAVPTGWGTSVYVADVQIGDTVVIIGLGGVGMNAVQGARMAGAKNIVAIDPVEWKREQGPTFGATHTAASCADALELVSDLTRGVMADRAVLTMGVVDGQLIDPSLALVSKGGVLAIGGVSAMQQTQAAFNVFGFVMMEKQIRGGLYGGCKPHVAIPMLLDLYRKGDLLLDELVTRTYALEDINQGYEDMEAGRNIRGVIVYDD
jgi:S-(hydroxymethyl)glutathione dehydrogenase/alcohol dehydrogenase